MSVRWANRFFFGMRRGVACLLLLAAAACGQADPAPVTHYGLHGGATASGVHTVAAGDTLWNIAQRYRVDMKDVIYVNHLAAPYVLAPGDRLALPPPLTYRVQAGDTLYGISRTFGVTVTQLARQNALGPPYGINRGQTLRLPSMRPPPSTLRSAAAAPSRVATAPARPVAAAPAASKTAAPAAKPPLPVSGGTPPRAGDRFAWPVTGPVLSSYGPKKGGLHNDGINIGAARGTPVRAAENGVVVYADSQLSGFGNLVLVRHADRWMTAYAHLDGMIVRRGQQVRRGETIGAVGRTGGVESPQLHFEIRRGTEALNPRAYLERQGT